MNSSIAEKIICPEPSTHPKLGRKRVITNNNNNIEKYVTNNNNNVEKYVTKTVFRERLKYQDNSTQTDISCFKKTVDYKEKYRNYKLYFSNRKVSNVEPNFMKETENKRYRNYLNETDMVEHMDYGNQTNEMMKFWNPTVYPFTKSKKY